MTIKMEDVSKALTELEEVLEKASDDDLTEAEGSDLDSGIHEGNELSKDSNEDEGASGAEKKSPKAAKSATAKHDEEEEEEEEEEKKPKKEEEEMKSLKDRADAEIEAKIEVSEFLKSLHDGLNDTLESMAQVVTKSAELYDTRAKGLEAQIADLQQNQAKIGLVLKAMCEQMGMIGNKRANEPKSVQKSGAKPGAPAERQFIDPKQVLDDAAEKSKMWPGLSDNPVIAKSQLLNVALDLAKGGKIEQTDVINLESNGHIRPEIVPMFQKAMTERSAA